MKNVMHRHILCIFTCSKRNLFDANGKQLSPIIEKTNLVINWKGMSMRKNKESERSHQTVAAL